MSDISDETQTEVYFFDEGRFGLKSSLSRSWYKKGKPFVVKVKQGYQNCYVYSAVAPKTGKHFSLILPYVNTEMMQIYLDQLSIECQDKRVILIMDQAGWHKSKHLIAPDNIELWFLPPYSPELNPIERLWKRLKQIMLHNRIYHSLTQLENAIIKFFNELTIEATCKLCCCSYI
jgi:transposase